MSRGLAAHRRGVGRGALLSAAGRPPHVRSTAMAPYGSWSTPVTSELIVRAAAGLGGVTVHGDTVTWSEQRPEEGGRTQLVQRVGDGPAVDLLPAGVQRPHRRPRVRRAGRGGSPGRTIWFANWDDQRLYRLTGKAMPVPVDRRARGPARRPVGRRRHRRRRTVAAGRARAPPARRRPGRGGQRGRRPRHQRRAGPARARDRARLRVRPPRLARRRPACAGCSGRIPTCRGTAPSCASPTCGRPRSDPPWPTRRSWPAGPTPLRAATGTASR